MYRINKIIYNGIEVLPDMTNTVIWPEFDKSDCSSRVKLIALLYDAISKRENYFQFNTPTAFGNPEYVKHCGIVAGMLLASGMTETTENNCITIKKGNRKVLVVDKIKRSRGYHDAVKENNKTLKELGF